MQTSAANEDSVLATAPIKPLVLKLALPSIVAQLINVLYNIVDKMYIGHLEGTGGLALAGLGVCTPIILLVSAFSGFIIGGAAPIAAIFLGRNEKEKAEEIAGTSFVFLLIVSAVLTLLTFLYKNQLLFFFGASEETFPYANAYFSIYLLGTVFVELALGMNAFISCQGKAVIAMISISIGAALNTILDPVFIFAFHQGVRGAAIATVISQAASSVFVLHVLASKNTDISLKAKNIRLQRTHLKNILALGISMFTMQATESAINFVFNIQLLRYGSYVHIAALALMQSVMTLFTVPVMGFTSGVQALFSFNCGAKKYDRIRGAIVFTFKIIFAFGIIYNSLVAFFPRTFARIFTNDEELTKIVSRLLPVFMLGMWIFAVQMLAQSFFVGTNKPGISFFIAVLRKVIILIPLACVLPIFFGVNGVFFAEPIADITSATLCAILLFLHLKKLR